MPIAEQSAIPGNSLLISGSQLEGANKLWFIKDIWRDIQERVIIWSLWDIGEEVEVNKVFLQWSVSRLSDRDNIMMRLAIL